jgi:Ca2+-binding EF-hand superfamily protein
MSMTVGGASGARGAGASTGASMRMSPQQKYANIFAQIDTSGSGSITKSQFEQAFSSLKMPPSFRKQGADATFAQLDPNGTGSVSKQDFVNGMVDQMKAMRAERASSSSNDGDADFDTLLNSLGSLSGSSTSSTQSGTSNGKGLSLNLTV